MDGARGGWRLGDLRSVTVGPRLWERPVLGLFFGLDFIRGWISSRCSLTSSRRRGITGSNFSLVGEGSSAPSPLQKQKQKLSLFILFQIMYNKYKMVQSMYRIRVYAIYSSFHRFATERLHTHTGSTIEMMTDQEIFSCASDRSIVLLQKEENQTMWIDKWSHDDKSLSLYDKVSRVWWDTASYRFRIILQYSIDRSSLYRGWSTRGWHAGNRHDLPRVFLLFLFLGHGSKQSIEKQSCDCTCVESIDESKKRNSQLRRIVCEGANTLQFSRDASQDRGFVLLSACKALSLSLPLSLRVF